jgi:hypothetical protein
VTFKESTVFEADIYWEGKSGSKYGYWIHPIGTSFFNKPGNYILAKRTGPGSWEPVYIGQASSLEGPFADPEKQTCARDNGATHVHVHTSSYSEASRKAEMSDLIEKWAPACN